MKSLLQLADEGTLAGVWELGQKLSNLGDQEDSLSYLMAESKRVKGELQQAQNVLASYSSPLEAEKALAKLDGAKIKGRTDQNHPAV